MPYYHKLSMRVELINEITILVGTESMLFYTNILDPDQKEIVAWINFSILVF